jgi:hypothetical protein
LIASGTDPALATAIRALGWKVQPEDGVTIVTVPPAASLDYYSLTGDYWPTPAAANWMGRKITIVTHKSPLYLRLLGTWSQPSPTLQMSATIDGQTTAYTVTRGITIPLDVPPYSTAVIATDETWMPNGGDKRQLSVTVAPGRAVKLRPVQQRRDVVEPQHKIFRRKGERALERVVQQANQSENGTYADREGDDEH